MFMDVCHEECILGSGGTHGGGSLIHPLAPDRERVMGYYRTIRINSMNAFSKPHQHYKNRTGIIIIIIISNKSETVFSECLAAVLDPCILERCYLETIRSIWDVVVVVVSKKHLHHHHQRQQQ